MTIKKLLLVLFMVGLTFSLFAHGQRDQYGKRHEDLEKLIESKEKVTLTGQLIINNRLLPELKVGTEVYKLMVPRFCLNTIEVDEGTEVSVEGVVLTVKEGIETRMFSAGEKVLFVEKAIINGEEYDLQKEFEGCNGPRGGWEKKGKGFHHMGPRGQGPRGPGEELFE